MSHRVSSDHIAGRHVLLNNLLRVLLCGIELLLEELDLALERITCRLARLGVLCRRLGLGELGFVLLALLLSKRQLVVERCDLLVLGEQSLLELLDLGLSGLSTRDSSIGLGTEGCKTLSDRVSI